jgi:hypothetical protein
VRETNGELKDYIPNFTWFGKAPFCGADPCDVYMAGMIPIKNNKCGDGSCCWFGEKWMGMRPFTNDHKKNIEDGRKECMELKKVQLQTLQSALGFGSSVLGAISPAKK